MRKIILLGILLFVNLLSSAKFYDFTAQSIDNKTIKMSDYKGKVVLVVNVASKCGFTSQYEGLQALYQKYKEKGFVILGFPCNQFGSQEKGTNQEIKHFCSTNYGVSFPMFSKIDVNGENAHPLFKFLQTEQSGFLTDKIKWNFTKFLIDREGKAIERYSPTTTPETIEDYLEEFFESESNTQDNSMTQSRNYEDQDDREQEEDMDNSYGDEY